ncbi:MAG: hypothetical protein SX243_01375 [Acidobacteriota bacterium]|nr:hypothetical protein [Acidobacteriota bacterium]
MTRFIGGLAKFLITRRGASVEVVRKAATAWIAELNPEGFSGDACFSGGCNKPFSEGGCGGMSEKRLKFR